MSQIDPTIPWPQLAKFIGQLNHDLRNHLNAIELQAAFLGEIAESDEMKAEVVRLREMTETMNEEIQRLSGQVGKFQINSMTYRASELIEDLRDRVAKAQGERAAQIAWRIEPGDATLESDPELLLSAFSELIDNALTHNPGAGPILFRAGANGETIEFALVEPKAAPVEVAPNWGAAPLAHLRHGHYALGLFRARSIFEAHHGTFQTHFDRADSALVTTVTLPRAQP